MSYTYLTWGDSAAGVLRLKNQLQAESHAIITMPDDLRIGPLRDADSAKAAERLALWREIWQAQRNLNLQCDVEYWTEHWINARNALSRLVTQTNPVVIWIGNNAHDRLMLAMSASLIPPQVPILVADITTAAGFNWHENGAIALCPPETLLEVVPLLLSDTQRDELRREWQFWKASAAGWRELNSGGQIVDLPVDHFDDMLCRHLSAAQPRSLVRVVGNIMEKNPQILSGCFLFWRLDVLRKQQARE